MTTRKKYKLVLGDGAHGPGDITEIIIEDDGTIDAPDLPNWRGDYLVARCLSPTTYRGQELRYLVLSPRYAGVGLQDIRLSGGIVGVGRILPGFWEVRPSQFEVNQVQYWAVAKMSLLEG